jgi:uncharacterized protein YlxW (UPF0749 family)
VAQSTPGPQDPGPHDPAGAGRRKGALDASMTLLREVMERPLDAGYATAAARRAQGATPSRRALVLTLLLALVCGAVTTRSIAELRRPQPGATEARAALQAEVGRRSAAVDAQQHELDQLRSQVAALQARALTGRGGGNLAGRAQLLGLLSAESPVRGPGLQVTLADAPTATATAGGTDPRATPDGSQGRVLDHDVQIVVNGLWAAGAEAMAINGQRLTARSAIRYAGQAILVDFRPLVPPYVVSAIGDPSTLQTRFAAGSGGAYLQALRDNYGIRAGIVSPANLELPGAGGFSTRFARARNTSSAPSPSSGSPAPSGSASPGAASPTPSGPAAGTAASTPEVSP